MASLTETNYANVRQELEEFGYSIVHNVLTQELINKGEWLRLLCAHITTSKNS